jgi:hypothetical protein
MRRLLCIVFASSLVAGAYANSITTLFLKNNGGSNGGMVYFNVTVGSAGLDVTGFDVNTSSATAFNMTVFLAPTTYVGNTNSSANWTQVAIGSGTGTGIIDTPIHVTLASSFALSANTTYGMALGMDSGGNHQYTNGDGSNQNYSNSDVSLALGAASNTWYDASTFSPRVWNGTMYYDPVPEPASLTALGLGALVLIRRRRRQR